MARAVLTTVSVMTQCNIRIETCKIEMHRIRWNICSVSKLLLRTRVNGTDFYLTPECKCCISIEKGPNKLYVYICNKSSLKMKIERRLVFYTRKNKKLYEDANNDVYILEKGQEVNLNTDVVDEEDHDDIDLGGLPNDTLVIDIWINIKEIIGGKRKCAINDVDLNGNLRKNFKTMLESPIKSDVILQVGRERIPAHWAVLCSRSPYFKRMFSSEMAERKRNSVTFTDISATTLKTLVEFLYTANFIPNDKGGDMKDIFELYYAADKYEIMDLRELCTCEIMNNASADNVVQILQFGHRHSDKNLKAEVMSYIQQHSKAVLQTDSWKKFEASEPLTADAISFFLKKK